MANQRKHAPPRKGPAPGATAPGSKLSPQRRVWFRVALVVGMPLLVLASAEGFLRLINYGYSAHFLQKRVIRNRDVWTANPDFGRRFFPPGLVRYAQPFAFSCKQELKTLHVFVFGESAAMGDPDFKFGLPRMLEVLLRERFPDRRVQVINAAMVAINSHVILPIARDCSKRSADLWVVYMGNNEIIGPFGSASVFGTRAPALALVRISLWLKETRLAQLLSAGLYSIRQGSRPLPEWSGMEMMAEQRVRQDSPSTQRVYQNFERNLADLLKTGAEAGVPIVLCTVATNLKDCAPFASLHRVGLGAPELARWQTTYDAGVAAQQKEDLGRALASYEEAARLDDDFADLAFRRGECCRRMGRDLEATKFFREACDRDALQFRADSRINEIIHQSAAAFAAQRVILFDTVAHFARNSPQGIPGVEYFYEHVHLTPEGNYELARGVAEQAVRALSLESAGAWITKDECLHLLGFTDWNRYDAWNVIQDRIQKQPFTSQMDHTRQVQFVANQLERYRLATKPAQIRREASEVSKLVERFQDDPELRWNLAGLLQSAGDMAPAEEQWRRIIELQPQSALPVYNLARLLEELNRQSEALTFYKQCVRLNPQYFSARYALGSLSLKMDLLAEAIDQLKLAVAQRPGAVEARLALGQALARAQRPAEAERQLQEILRQDANNNAAHAQLKALRESN
jgi:tetratricopeptide (TPR) repeat protein